MRRIIHHIRRQPEHIRRHILHVLVLVSAGVLLLLWVYSLSQNLTDQNTKLKIENDIKSLSVLKDNLANGYRSISQIEE